VVGAYPRGQDWDICREASTEEARKRVTALPIPDADLIEGRAGMLTDQWK
jgi:uncharacterized protein YjlB